VIVYQEMLRNIFKKVQRTLSK